nr:MAG TPA: hypothetical protein [Caudoviricetes sp.]
MVSVVTLSMILKQGGSRIAHRGLKIAPLTLSFSKVT